VRKIFQYSLVAVDAFPLWKFSIKISQEVISSLLVADSLIAMLIQQMRTLIWSFAES
jgi:hypothetical protein